jgi:hypothetical protein
MVLVGIYSLLKVVVVHAKSGHWSQLDILEPIEAT